MTLFLLLLLTFLVVNDREAFENDKSSAGDKFGAASSDLWKVRLIQNLLIYRI